MRTTYIILGSFLLLVIGVCGYFFFFTGSGDSSVKWYGQVEQKIPSTYAESVMETQQVQVSDIDLYNTAIEQQDLSKCESISDIEKKNTCHDNIVASDAQKSLDTKKCQSLSQSGMVSICEDNIYNAQAIGKLDTSLCAKISAKNI